MTSRYSPQFPINTKVRPKAEYANGNGNALSRSDVFVVLQSTQLSTTVKSLDGRKFRSGTLATLVYRWTAPTGSWELADGKNDLSWWLHEKR